MPASVFNQVTVNAPAGSVAPATQIVEAGSGDVLVFNTSTAVTAYLSETNSSLSTDAGTPRVSPLGPQQSIVFNGDLDVFALVSPGLTAVLDLYPSATNYTPFVNVTALFQGGSGGVGGSLAVIAPGVTITPLSMADVTLYSSYDLSLALVNAALATAGSELCARVTLSWFDDLTSGLPVFQEIWNPWVVTGIPGSPPRGIIGSGPMHGKYFSLSITNAGTTNLTVQYLNVFGSPRPGQISDWRQFLNNSVTDAVLVNIFNTAVGFDNALADTGGSAALVAGTTYIMPFNLYSGPVDWCADFGPGIVITGMQVLDIGGNYQASTSGNVAFGVGILAGITAAAGTVIAGSLYLPRSGCALVIRVGGTGGNFSFTCSAQQGP